MCYKTDLLQRASNLQSGWYLQSDRFATDDKLGGFSAHQLKVGGNNRDTVFYIFFHGCLVVRNHSNFFTRRQFFLVALVEEAGQHTVAHHQVQIAGLNVEKL